MGKIASKFRVVVGRPIKNYNVESRAFKVISKDKPTPAPTYPSLEKVMREIKNGKDHDPFLPVTCIRLGMRIWMCLPLFSTLADPELLNKGKLSAAEIKNLSQVYVTSTGDNPVIKSKQKLPDDRHTHEEFLYGYQEPIKIPLGKVSLRQLLELLEKHAANPVKNSPEVLSVEYKLDLQTTQNVVEYFRTFRVYLQPKGPEPGRLEMAKNLIVKPFVFDNKTKGPGKKWRQISWSYSWRDIGKDQRELDWQPSLVERRAGKFQ